MKAQSFPHPDKQLLTRLGQTIKSLRKKHGLTIEAFAEKCGLHPKYIQTIEQGKRNVSISVFIRLATASEVKATQLLKKIS